MSLNPEILTGLKIRPMTVEDIDEVLKIERVSFPNPWTREQFAGEFKNPVSKPCVLTIPNNGSETLVAYMIFWVVHGEAHILNIAVRPGFRRRGVARCMLSKALEMMRSALVFEVFLEVRRSNAAARALYHSFGFKEVYERKRYYGDEDAIVMALTF